jgi:hypothetical protein
MIEENTLISTEEVFQELKRVEDDLLIWAKQYRKLFRPIDVPIQSVVKTILQQFPTALDLKQNKSGGDPFVIALAKQEGACVITSEKLSRSPLKPKIPDICNALSVPYMTPLQFLQKQQWRFVLDSPAA